MYTDNSIENVEDILKKKRIQLLIKRIFDIIASMIGIIVLSPVFIIISVLIKLNSEGPAIFKQDRVGRNSKVFKIYKFRTMVDNAESLGKQLTVGEDKRITKVGRVLRKYRLDEFAQLFNVLKGEMSLVGPRPEVPQYANTYFGFQRQVFMIRPGITDYASIEYKDESRLLASSSKPEEMYTKIILPRKIDLKLKYIREISFFTDLKIIYLTLKCILRYSKKS